MNEATSLSARKLRFIPFRKQDLIEMCLQQGLPENQTDDFELLCHMLASIFHFRFHRNIEALKNAYASVDPDSDTVQSVQSKTQSNPNFIKLLDGLLEKANYERISEADLNQAMSESSLFNIRLQVDLGDFSEVSLFCRGESLRQEQISRFFGLRSKTIEFTNYERVVVYIQFRKDLEEEKQSQPGCKPGVTLLKLFRNVPKADLEMLFPNTRVRMRTIDKLLIGIPAVISGGIVLTTKLGASLILLGSLFGFWVGINNQPVELNQAALVALLAGFVALGGYLWKQFNNFKNRKMRFMQALTRNLYFKNLDNNAGVFHRLADDAEEEECKEAILSYYFLLMSEQDLSRDELDQRIEHWLASKYDRQINFEIGDALQKLTILELIKHIDNKYSAVPIADAISRLDKRWDDYFKADELIQPDTQPKI